MKIKKASLRVTAIILALVANTAFGETYALVFDSNCSSRGEKLEFSCKSEPSFSSQNTTIFLRDGACAMELGSALRAQAGKCFRLALSRKMRT